MARTQAADYEQRREAILDKAASLFAQRGFLGASMLDLAAACDISKSLLYHYYSSKEDLLYAVMLSHLDQLLEAVARIMDEERAPKAKLSALIHAFMSHYVGASARQKVLLNELDNLPAAQRATIVEKQRDIVEDLQRLIGDAFGEARSAASARVRTMLVFGMINWTHTWFDPSGPVSADELADMVMGIAAGGVGAGLIT